MPPSYITFLMSCGGRVLRAMNRAYEGRLSEEELVALASATGSDVCWYKGIELEGRKARKTENCIGCGYCFQVCPTGALKVDARGILKSSFEEN